MPIEMKPAAWIGQQVFPTIQEAQESELEELFSAALQQPIDNFPKWAAKAAVQHTDEIVAILTCAPKTKKPRSDKGTHRKKTPYVAVNAALQDAKQ